MYNIFIKLIVRVIRILPDLRIGYLSAYKILARAIANRYGHDVKADYLMCQYEEYSSDTDYVAHSVKIFKECGVVVLRGLFDSQRCLREGSYIEELTDTFVENGGANSVNDINVLIQREPFLISSYDQLISHHGTLINIRGSDDPDYRSLGGDDGMLDVFHVNRILDQAKNIDIHRFVEHDIISRIIGEVHPPAKLKAVNFYLNRGVENTRGLHIDTPTVEYKAFMLLSEVTDLSDGPYCYVPGSNHNVGTSLVVMAFNQLFRPNKPITDIHFCDNNEALKIFGRPGDVILSDQRGIHRGWPQARGGHRAMLVNVLNS